MLSEVIEPRMREILKLSFEEIKKSDMLTKLNFGVVITGGGSQLRNIIDLAQEIFCMPVKIGYPDTINGLDSKYKNNPKYATAIGIIQYACRKGYSSIEDNNLVNSSKNLFNRIIKYLTDWY